MSLPAFSGLCTYGPAATLELPGGYTAQARIQYDDSMGEPWKEHDGHGPVTDWRRASYRHGRPAKSPGERLLVSDGSNARFYDFAEAVRIALRDGWGCEGGRKKGETARAYAARAAEADFRRLQAWCSGEWHWCGVVVTVFKAGIELGSASLWGIESDAGDYLAEVANELLPEALDDAKARVAELAEELAA
ncbi:hypothetical protein [Enterovirga aerilata]|uniref:Uncharacterized protein n=1 Tax=Enterovirga aerilata TaxID=2730920 RepID=A0A849IA69_9HYPH|nr:hypothetical protein [Enterovirga sp. DB1703]NNM74764.1 hypothetical protein [Enterovirga sp. DB1703]